MWNGKKAIAENEMVGGHQIKKNVFFVETFSLHMRDQSCKSAEVQIESLNKFPGKKY